MGKIDVADLLEETAKIPMSQSVRIAMYLSWFGMKSNPPIVEDARGVAR